MIEIISSIIGFGASFFPSLLNYFQDKRDKAHELAMLTKQEEIRAQSAKETAELNNIAIELDTERESIRGAHNSMKPTGVPFIDGLRGSVRPIVTYWFMALYSYSKYVAYLQAQPLWTEADRAIFATIISFWFGDRIRKYLDARLK